MSDLATLSERLNQQRARIAQSEKSAGRRPGSVRLIAVSKKQSADKIVEAYAAGQRDFGENYVQELVEKAAKLSQYPDIRWHLIGHLQSNKAKFVTGLVQSVHTITSVKLAQELGNRMRQRLRTVAASPEATRAKGQGLVDSLPPMSMLPLEVLVEVNVSGEASKSGCRPEELSTILEAIDAEPYLSLRGLMTMPPYNENPELTLPYFEKLALLRAENGGAERLPELSMGMSHDAEFAVKAGATMVRIGTAIFGERPSV